MDKIPYTTKSGLRQFHPVCTDAELSEERSTGFCLACGEEASGVEPDARKYTCESCGAAKVYGLEELCMMGLVKIVEECE
jgi:hypothetical protein